jgi:ribosomal protein S18 acetylase RimI-like enzyme
MPVIVRKGCLVPQLTIRPYVESDWPRISEIHDQARYDELRGSVDLGVYRPLAEVAEAEGLFASRIWVAENLEDRQVAGFVAATDTEITWLYVDPAKYRQGVGGQLLRHAITQCGPVVHVMVLAQNAAARALYEREGFVVTKTFALNFAEGEQYTAEGAILTLDRSQEH